MVRTQERPDRKYKWQNGAGKSNSLIIIKQLIKRFFSIFCIIQVTKLSYFSLNLMIIATKIKLFYLDLINLNLINKKINNNNFFLP